jgi:hypothetical protein
MVHHINHMHQKPYPHKVVEIFPNAMAHGYGGPKQFNKVTISVYIYIFFIYLYPMVSFGFWLVGLGSNQRIVSHTPQVDIKYKVVIFIKKKIQGSTITQVTPAVSSIYECDLIVQFSPSRLNLKVKL